MVILSVTEGDDKPIKYPDAFAAAELMVISKTDLLPHVDFDVAACIEHARCVNPDIRSHRSCPPRAAEGMDDWIAWVAAQQRRVLEAERHSLEARLAKLRRHWQRGRMEARPDA